jgi:hypothetical protein
MIGFLPSGRVAPVYRWRGLKGSPFLVPKAVKSMTFNKRPKQL